MEPRHYTDEEKAEILSNPYTARVTDCRVTYTLAFKQLVMENIDKPGMTARKVFQMAGYRDRLFEGRIMRYVVHQIRREAQSAEGLREPAIPKREHVKKKRPETEYKELLDRIELLEQQIRFLKKSQFLKDQDRLMHQHNSE